MNGKDAGSGRVHVAIAILLAGDRCLIRRRSPQKHLPLLWEFPGGKVANGETPLEAAIREVREETGIVAEEARSEHLARGAFDYPDRKLLLDFFLFRLKSVPPAGGARWVPVAELGNYEFPSANREILEYLKRRSTR